MTPDSTKTARVVELDLMIRRDEALRYLGYPSDRTPPDRIAARFEAAVVEARSLLRTARGAWRAISPHEAAKLGLPAFPGRQVVGLVTAGPQLEARCATLIAGGDATGALLLDAIGSAAAEEAADRVCAMIVEEQASLVTDSRSIGADSRVSIACYRTSPGYGDWPLTCQQPLFALLPHERIGVRLLPSFLMVPRKSVSFALAFDLDGRPVAGPSRCSQCATHGTCLYQRESPRTRLAREP